MVSLSLVEQVDLADVRLSVTVSGSGPVVILAHGFPDDASTWQAQVSAIVAAGYRAVVPTMRGYAPSGVAASGRYDLLTLGHDLLALADRYSPREPVRLVGHDWGAAASYAAAAIAERVACLASLAVPHMRAFLRAAMTSRQALRSSYMLLFQLRGIAEAIVEARDHAFVDFLWRRWSPGYTPTASEMEAVKAGLYGRVSEALAYYRAIPKALASAPMTKLLLGRPTKVPTLHLHGADDGCIGAEAIEGAARYHAASYEAHVIPRAGHFLQRERPDEVSERLIAYLGRFA